MKITTLRPTKSSANQKIHLTIRDSYTEFITKSQPKFKTLYMQRFIACDIEQIRTFRAEKHFIKFCSVN